MGAVSFWRIMATDPDLPGGDVSSDAGMFARSFLSHHTRCRFSMMHEFSFQQYAARLSGRLPHRRGRRLAIAAPRGSAKSTVHTLILPLMDIVFRRERHVVIVSATQKQAVNRLANIRRELLNNAALHKAFFGSKSPEMESTRRSLLINDVKLEAYGCGSEIRGISHGEYRPTHIILDDVEASRVAMVDYRRKQLIEWYDEVIENLGDTYTHITIVGTILHPKSLLSTLLERPGYTGEIYQSIMQWSRNNELWYRWRNLFLNQADRHREAKSDQFFKKHKAAMLEGTQVLWPQKETYLDLQKLYFNIGQRAFAKEKQNHPLNSDSRVFDTARWTRFISPEQKIIIVPPPAQALISANSPWNDESAQDEVYFPDYLKSAAPDNEDKSTLPKLDDLHYYGFLDPALGRENSRDGDYAAIVTIGRAPNGTCYVLDVWMQKAKPSQQITRVFELHRQYSYRLFGYEANGFQETLGKDLKVISKELYNKGQSTLLPLKPWQNTENKRSRICMLEPPITTGMIRFQQYLPVEFFNQADEFGTPRCHDDALDALSSCYEMILKLHAGANGLRRVKGRKGGRF